MSSRSAFLALRAAVGWYADVLDSQPLEVFGYEMELLPDGASSDPALSAIFIRIATYELPDIWCAFKVAAGFARTEIIALRKIEIGVRIETDLLLASQQDADTLASEPIALFRHVLERSEEVEDERHAKYWHLKEKF